MNRLLEIYARGLINSLQKEQVLFCADTLREIHSNMDGKTRDFFKNKTVKYQDKLDAALEIFTDNLELQSFAKTLAANSRLDILPDVIKFFPDYALKFLDKTPAKVTLKVEIDEEIKNEIENFITENYGKDTPIEYDYTPNMIGGIVIKYRDNEIDLSINNKFDGLKEALIN